MRSLATALAAVDLGEFIGGNHAVGAERIHVDVGTAGRQVMNLLRPVNAESRVDGGDHVFDARLRLVVPAGIDAARAVGVGSAENHTALHAGAREQRGKHILVVVAAGHVV